MGELELVKSTHHLELLDPGVQSGEPATARLLLVSKRVNAATMIKSIIASLIGPTTVRAAAIATWKTDSEPWHRFSRSVA